MKLAEKKIRLWFNKLHKPALGKCLRLDAFFLHLILQFNLIQTSSLPCFALWIHHVGSQTLCWHKRGKSKLQDEATKNIMTVFFISHWFKRFSDREGKNLYLCSSVNSNILPRFRVCFICIFAYVNAG